MWEGTVGSASEPTLVSENYLSQAVELTEHGLITSGCATSPVTSG